MISKKEFKTKCYFNEYGRGKNKVNAIWFDWLTKARIENPRYEKDYFAGYKFMVSADVRDCKKDELFTVMYNWVLKQENVPWYVNYKYAETDNQRFKVPLSMKVRNS